MQSAMKLVKDILSSKGHEVFTISSTATLLDMAVDLGNRKIGILVCTDQSGGLIGIISERDLTRKIARHGAAALSLTVGEAMTRDVFACSLSDTAQELLQVMSEARCRHLPVIDEGKLVGLISIGDLVKAVTAG